MTQTMGRGQCQGEYRSVSTEVRVLRIPGRLRKFFARNSVLTTALVDRRC